jgi:hypothetical protein
MGGIPDADAAARAWSDAWSRAWAARDADLLAPVYADGAIHLSHPFREPGSPIDYARWAFADEDELLECRFGAPFVVGDDRAVVEWWAVTRNGDRTVTLAGASLVRFVQDGRCVEHRDYWAETEGRGPGPCWE